MARILAVVVGVGLAISVFTIGRSWADRRRHDRWFADRPSAELSVRDGALPDALPQQIRNVYERRDSASRDVWARFELEPARRPVLEGQWQSAAWEDSVKIVDPGKTLWWPRALRGRVTRAHLHSAGLETYRIRVRRDAPEPRGWLFVDWKLATAYYFLPGT